MGSDPPPDSRTALERATRCLEDGAFDPRTTDGATTNALESIAWSLIGLLHERREAEAEALGDAAQETLTQALRDAGLLELPRQK